MYREEQEMHFVRRNQVSRISYVVYSDCLSMFVCMSILTGRIRN